MGCLGSLIKVGAGIGIGLMLASSCNETSAAVNTNYKTFTEAINPVYQTKQDSGYKPLFDEFAPIKKMEDIKDVRYK